MRIASLGIFVVATVGAGLAIGYATAPGVWYEGLAKPWFTPPGWLFPPVWTLLYILIGVAGWQVWRSHDRVALGLWGLQLGLNFLWSPLFFGLERIGAGFAVILLLLAAILAFLVRTYSRDRAAFLCFVPYALWVAYAALLNGSIWWMN